MKHWLMGCCCALVSVFALVESHAAPVDVESSMLLTGSVTIARDGSVRSHAIDQPDKVPSAVRAFADKAIATWKFVPIVVDGQTVVAQAKMHLRLVANRTGEGKYAIRVGGVSFDDDASNESLRFDDAVNRQFPPRYPHVALQARTGAVVYLLLKVGHQGAVMDAAAEQVNLTNIGDAVEMRRLRRAFANASIKAAKHWRFIAPTSGPLIDQPVWYASVPVTFVLSTEKPAADSMDTYGHWQQYVRGPQEPVPWANAPRSTADAVDTTPDGSVRMLGAGPQFATSGD